MKRRKKITKINNSQQITMNYKSNRKWLKCSTCSEEVLVDENVVAVRCAICTTKMVPVEIKLVQGKQKSDKPAGWRFMAEFVDSEGNVYHYGKEQPHLKGTKEPSDVGKIREEQRKKRKEKKKKKELRNKIREQRLINEYKRKQKLKKKLAEKKQQELNKKLDEKEQKTKIKKVKSKKKRKIK